MENNCLIEELKKESPLISVGILTADMMNLGSEIELLEKTGVKLLHIDVMDGGIWPKITIGAGFLGGLKTTMLKDVHLLIDKPENHIEDFVKAGADIIIFSVEYCGDVPQTLSQISQLKNVNDPDRGILKGLSLNPETPIDVVADVIDGVDIVLLLAVSPKAGKQTFISELPDRIAEIKKINKEIGRAHV